MWETQCCVNVKKGSPLLPPPKKSCTPQNMTRFLPASKSSKAPLLYILYTLAHTVVEYMKKNVRYTVTVQHRTRKLLLIQLSVLFTKL